MVIYPRAKGHDRLREVRPLPVGGDRPAHRLVLRTQIAARHEFDTGLTGDALVFVMPVRGAKRSQDRWESAGVAEAMCRRACSGMSRGAASWTVCFCQSRKTVVRSTRSARPRRR